MVALSEEIESLRRARDRLEGRRVELQLQLAAEKLAGAVSGVGGGRRGGGRGGGKQAMFVRWKAVCVEAREERLREEVHSLEDKAERYEVSVNTAGDGK